MLCRLGLKLARRGDIRHQGHVDIHHILTARLSSQLPESLKKRQALYVAYRTAHLNNDNIRSVFPEASDTILDFVGDVGNDLYGSAEVVATPLFGEHRGVYGAGGDVIVAGDVDVDEPFVVA